MADETSHISETDFPVQCNRCGHGLVGLGESGACPRCGLGYSRRERLWQAHGPEAFADPPITPAEQELARQDTAFIRGLLAVVAVTLTLPLVLLLWLMVFGTIDVGACLLVWTVVALAAAWLAVAGRYPQDDSEQLTGGESGG